MIDILLLSFSRHLRVTCRNGKLVAYANDFPELPLDITSEGRFKITSNKDVTNILNILEERVYKTPITEENREAHSVTRLVG